MYNENYRCQDSTVTHQNDLRSSSLNRIKECVIEHVYKNTIRIEYVSQNVAYIFKHISCSAISIWNLLLLEIVEFSYKLVHHHLIWPFICNVREHMDMHKKWIWRVHSYRCVMEGQFEDDRRWNCVLYLRILISMIFFRYPYPSHNLNTTIRFIDGMRIQYCLIELKSLWAREDNDTLDALSTSRKIQKFFSKNLWKNRIDPDERHISTHVDTFLDHIWIYCAHIQTRN